MGILDIILTGIGLSMDAAAVGMTNGMHENKMKTGKILLIALFYGLFQALMPLIGYFAASLFAEFIASIAPYVALVLLAFIGGKMIYEATHSECEGDCRPLTIPTLIVQSVATAIDALAVGIAICASEAAGTLLVNPFICFIIFFVITFVLSVIAVILGKKIGELLADKAELIGGIILILIGLKIFVEGVIIPLF